MCGKDRKSLYAIRAGKLLTINSDHANIAMFEGEFLGKKDDTDSVAEGISNGASTGEHRGSSLHNILEQLALPGQNDAEV